MIPVVPPQLELDARDDDAPAVCIPVPWPAPAARPVADPEAQIDLAVQLLEPPPRELVLDLHPAVLCWRLNAQAKLVPAPRRRRRRRRAGLRWISGVLLLAVVLVLGRLGAGIVPLGGGASLGAGALP